VRIALSRIRFEKLLETSEILSPLKGYETDAHEIEIRMDPLTGRKSLIGLRLAEKYETLVGKTDDSLIEKMASESTSKCFFCPERVMSSTPKFSKTILPEGRLIRGDAVLFPNLYPLSKFHAIIVPTKQHFLRPEEFSERILLDMFLVARDFISRIQTQSVLFASINSNYMPPAGASAIHPHFQLIITTYPSNRSRLIDNSLEAYMHKHHSNYWDDLIDAEKANGERYIGATGSIEWLTPFSPSGANEVLGILPLTPYTQLSDSELTSLALGVSKILGYYGEQQYSSFNFSLDLGNVVPDNTKARAILRIVTRQNFSSGYRAAEHFFQHMLETEVIVVPPEVLAGKLIPRFSGE